MMMKNLTRKYATYKMYELPDIINPGFEWNGKIGYTGSIIKRSLLKATSIFQHFGIIYGFDSNNTLWVIENNLDGVECVTFDDFMNGENYFEIEHQTNSDAKKLIEILNRAKERSGLVYSLDKNNCEMFANYCFYGVTTSKQIENAKLILNGVITYLEFRVANTNDEIKHSFLESLAEFRAEFEIKRPEELTRIIDRKK